MTPTEPAEVIEAHRLWMAGEGGSRADLSGADLRYANLSGANHDNWTTWPSGFTPPQ